MMEFDGGNERGARLLIVDDNAEITDVLEELGLEAGYLVKSAQDLESVKREYLEFNPGVILLDLGLGGGDGDDSYGSGDEGLEVMEYLSQQQSQALIVIVSGMSRRKRELTQIQGLGLNLRVMGHLSKPFDVDKVEEMLVKLREKVL